MSYRVCIPCAGTGSRLGSLTEFVNKSLVSVANRPTLSHLVERFADDIEFVIALGYKGHLVREFVELVYPNRKFHFVEVTPYEGLNSGLGLSLLACKDLLQEPFIFISCDTLVEEPIPAPNENWMGFAELADIASYRTVRVEQGFVRDIAEKNTGRGVRNPYIGLAGIHDYENFWLAMEDGGAEAVEIGEVFGLRQLCSTSVKAYPFTWHDTGSLDTLEKARGRYRKPHEPNILDKANEAIWFVGNKVVKFSDDQMFIANRVKRVAQLEGFVPQIIKSQPHMYLYEKVKGEVFSEVVTLPLFNRLLGYCEVFWVRSKFDSQYQIALKASCKVFYKKKTLERVELFYKAFDKFDGTEPINGVEMPTLRSLLEGLDWDWLSDGVFGRFHGDFHFENILWNELEQKFSFLDWRQDFAGDLHIGDIYYDLAKLLHGLIVNHGLITQGYYSVNWSEAQIDFDLHRRQILVECEQSFYLWLDEMGYDRDKVWTLTALIFLNIASLHHRPYGLLLYALGKSMLFKAPKFK